MIDNPITKNLHRVDPQMDKVVDECAGCGGELYYGQPIFKVNGDAMHDISDCRHEYLENIGYRTTAE